VTALVLGIELGADRLELLHLQRLHLDPSSAFRRTDQLSTARSPNARTPRSIIRKGKALLSGKRCEVLAGSVAPPKGEGR
jgi:hypothetical protein